jgi:hypothetical protein
LENSCVYNVAAVIAARMKLPGAEATLESQTRLKPSPDPFNPEALRLDQSFIEGGSVKKLLTSIPVRKPNPQDWFRVHAAEDYRLPVALIVLKDDRETYLVLPSMAGELVGEWAPHILYTVINRQGVLSIWAVRLPGSDGRQSEWWRSSQEAAELAMKKWMRIKADMALGAYQLYEAASSIPDPEWPDLPFTEMLRVAFRDRLVDHADHPVLKRLRGAT